MQNTVQNKYFRIGESTNGTQEKFYTHERTGHESSKFDEAN